jgi:hypothetical protein
MMIYPMSQPELSLSEEESGVVPPELRDGFFSPLALPEKLHRHIRGNPVGALVATPDGEMVKLEQMSSYLWTACLEDLTRCSDPSGFDWELDSLRSSVYNSVSKVLAGIRGVWREYDEDEDLFIARLRSHILNGNTALDGDFQYGHIVKEYIQMILLTEDGNYPSSYDLNRKYHPYSTLPILLEYYLVQYIEQHFPGSADLSSPFHDKNGIDVHYSLDGPGDELPIDVKYGRWGVKIGRNGTHLSARRRDGYVGPDEDFPNQVVFIMIGSTSGLVPVGAYCGSVGKVLGDALLAMKGIPLPPCTRMHTCLNRAVKLSKGVKF